MIDLQANQISDLSPLSTAPSLVYINASLNRISDLRNSPAGRAAIEAWAQTITIDAYIGDPVPTVYWSEEKTYPLQFDAGDTATLAPDGTWATAGTATGSWEQDDFRAFSGTMTFTVKERPVVPVEPTDPLAPTEPVTPTEPTAPEVPAPVAPAPPAIPTSGAGALASDSSLAQTGLDTAATVVAAVAGTAVIAVGTLMLLARRRRRDEDDLTRTTD